MRRDGDLVLEPERSDCQPERVFVHTSLRTSRGQLLRIRMSTPVGEDFHFAHGELWAALHGRGHGDGVDDE